MHTVFLLTMTLAMNVAYSPVVAQKNVVEVVVDVQQLLSHGLAGHARDELHYSLLHGSAGPVQLLNKRKSEEKNSTFIHQRALNVSINSPMLQREATVLTCNKS